MMRRARPSSWFVSLWTGSLVFLSATTVIAQEGLPTPHSRAAAPIAAWNDFPDWVTSLTFEKNGKHLCIGTYEELQRRDIQDKQPPQTLAVAPGYVKALALSPDGKTLAAGHYQSATLIDLSKWSIRKRLGDFAAYVTGLAYSPDGKRIAVACEDGSALICDAADRKTVVRLPVHSDPVRGIAFSHDGKQVATAAGDDTRVTHAGEVKVFNAADGKQVFSFGNPKQAATAVAFSPDDKWLASTGYDTRVLLYDLAAGKAASFFPGHGRPTNAVLFLSKGEILASASGGRVEGGNEVKLWKRESGEELVTFNVHAARVDALALSPDESLLASGGYDKAVYVWRIKESLDRKKNPASDLADSGQPIAAGRALLAAAKEVARSQHSPVVRIGIIGLDTSHCGAFASALNDPKALPDISGFRVVAAYPKGSPDIKSSVERVPGYIKDMKKLGVEIVDSIDALLDKVDVVLLETNDGRPHLSQALPVLKRGKPLFIDKPIAGSLADAVAIFEAADHYHVPVFSSSSLRFGKSTQAARSGRIGKISSCETSSPCTLEKTHPDLFWYGIHGVESLFTVMGPGCKSVRRTVSTPHEDVVVGDWGDGRTGTFRGTRPGKRYGGIAKGSKGTLEVGQSEGYRPLVVEIVRFFKTKVPPVSERETLEIYAFMEAADESKRRGGAEVSLESVLEKARHQARKHSSWKETE